MWGALMQMGTEIEQLRLERKIPMWIMCQTMNLDSEAEYAEIIYGRTAPTVYQMIMLIELFKCGFNSPLFPQ